MDGNVSIGGAGTNEGNAALTAAPALEALTTIGGNLVIANNGVLTTVPVFLCLPPLRATLRLRVIPD